MNICAPFIKRPVMTTLVMVSALLFGIMAYTRLPVSDLPNVDFPTILVNAALPGANPETIATAVATPLEREFSTISGLDSMSSTSSLGSVQITLQFDLHRDIAAAAQDVQAAISRAANQLPEDMPNPPSYRKVNPADQPILYLALTFWLFKIVPKGFIPSEDRSQIFALTEAAEDISWDSMKQHQQALAEIVRRDPNVESFMSSAGARAGSITGSNSGVIFIRLKPRSERRLTVDQIIEELRPKLAEVPGIRVFMQNLPLIRIGGRLTKSQYQYALQSTDIQELYQYAPLFADKLRSLPGFQDVTTDLQLKNPQVNVEIDRDKAATLGITVLQIEDALYSAYGARQISTIYAATDQYAVIMELEPRYQLDPQALSMLYIRSAEGALVALDAVSTITTGFGPLTVNHSGQLPAVTVSFNLKPGFALGNAVEAINRVAVDVLPATVTGSFQGAAQVFESSLRDLGVLLIIAILVIYIVLGILYESFIHPLTILSALPFAGFGALVTLQAFGAQLDIYSFVGLIMLVGLVKKNGIIMIDFAIEAQRQEGKSARDAIFEACVVRFRPIMMTSMAALMGSLPIAVGWGAGGESRKPLGLAVVGGLLFSQFLTLFVTPVFYLYMDEVQAFLNRRPSRRRPALHP
jgi:HAE1 family hydrophobic/amphiphilic exporter-1